MGQVLVRETGVKESSSISVHLKVKQDFFFFPFVLASSYFSVP
jgi:hypothetical protein